MNVFPVIERELRVQSRLSFTYLSRVMGVAVLLGVCLVFANSYGLTPSLGGLLFACLNGALLVSIWVLVPLLCADCISRERREGTVGLLFLTPLKARDVVLAKGLVHGLRAFSLLLAVVPIVTIAFLLGGVSWIQAALSVMNDFNSICWALAAGLLASSIGKSWVGSQIYACLLAVCLGFFFLLATGYNLRWFLGRPVWMPYTISINFGQSLMTGFFAVTNLDQWWGIMYGNYGIPPAFSPQTPSWLFAQGRMVVMAIVVLVVAIEIAAGNLRRAWREEPPSAHRIWLEKKFFTPVLWVSFFNAWMRRKLQRNPIGWLETRSWSGRLVTWGWFAVMISVYSAAFNNTDVSRSLDLLQKFMAWLLLGVMVVSSAGSFQRERETGVLELLLVSPMSVGQIIGGRLRGLWGQFLPACMVLLGIWIYLAELFPAQTQRSGFGLIQFFCGAFLTLPVIGLFYSLKCANFISAFLSTVLVGLLVPFGLRLTLNALVGFFLGINPYYWQDFIQPRQNDSFGTVLIYVLLRGISSSSFMTILQLALAAWIGRRLYRDMERRNFAFSRAVA